MTKTPVGDTYYIHDTIIQLQIYVDITSILDGIFYGKINFSFNKLNKKFANLIPN